MSLTSIIVAAAAALLAIGLARSRNEAADSPDIRLDTATEADVYTLLSAGRKIEAIKVYRRLHGVDLKAAKDAIDRLAASLPPPGDS